MADLAPLVLLPGLLCDARLWREQALALHDVADIQVADLTLDDSVAAMAARVLAAAPERFALGGLSMGGYVAFEILRQAPERVTRLALFSTSAAPDSPQRAEQRRRAMAALSVGRFLGVTQQMMPQLLPPSRLNDPLAGEVKAMAGRVGGEAFLRQQRAIL
ncbi:alpha/beta hydrolase, partial [Caulobacter sp. D4A]